MGKAANRLGMAIQTISTQVRELEKQLGHELLRPAGRGLELTPAGRVALQQADQIFQLGEQLPQRLRDATQQANVLLRVGTSDGLPKIVVSRLLDPIIRLPNIRLIVEEGEFDELCGQLALHKLDVVLADRALGANPNLKLHDHQLGRSALAWYATESLLAQLEPNHTNHTLPQCLAQLPMLLPSRHAAVRLRIDLWLEQHNIVPNIIGEFEDSALLKTFGAQGLGVFPAPEWVHDDLQRRYGVRYLGQSEGLEEQFFAIATTKKVQHPLVSQLLAAAASHLEEKSV